MFGLPFFQQRRPQVMPHEVLPQDAESVLLQDQALANGITLVTKEDIYYRKGSHSVLLMKAGQKVQAALIPKLIKFGITPEQFSFEDPAVMALFETALDAHRPYQMMSGDVDDTPTLLNRKSGRDKILIFDTDERCLKRLTDCLSACGIPSDNIHPVPLSVHLEWALEKYRPEVVFLDFVPYSAGSREQPNVNHLMELIGRYDFLEQVVLTTTISSEKESLRQEMEALAAHHNVKLLFKPINRFTVSEVLSASLANR